MFDDFLKWGHTEGVWCAPLQKLSNIAKMLKKKHFSSCIKPMAGPEPSLIYFDKMVFETFLLCTLKKS